MSKIAVVYWSGTGNTEVMAKAIVDGVKGAGKEVELFTPEDFDASKVDDFDAIAFGCPSMGDEVLEEAEFDPMYQDCKEKLGGKNVALFGSYGWGDGQWMRDWEEDCEATGAVLAVPYLILNELPDDEGIEKCKEFGAALANA